MSFEETPVQANAQPALSGTATLPRARVRNA